MMAWFMSISFDGVFMSNWQEIKKRPESRDSGLCLAAMIRDSLGILIWVQGLLLSGPVNPPTEGWLGPHASAYVATRV